MATGHALVALVGARDELGDAATWSDLDPVVEGATRWLKAKVNDDSSWGVEPDRRPEGRPGRLISTAYALRGLTAAGHSYETSEHVRKAVEWVKGLQDPQSGGFSASPGGQADPCSTARSLSVLHRCGAIERDDAQCRKALAFLSDTKPTRKLWPLTAESYVSGATAGQTTFNSNTTADVLEAVLRLDQESRHVPKLVDWYMSHQEDNGSWHLGANDQADSTVVTWPTCEAILVLSMVEVGSPTDVVVDSLRRRLARSRVWISALTVALLAASLLIFGVPDALQSAWDLIPSWLRDRTLEVLIVGVVIAGLVNLVTNRISNRYERRDRK